MKKMTKNNLLSLKLKKTKKGSILVFALIILSFILLATFSLSTLSVIERRSADISVNSSTAFQQADKGMEEFLQQIYKDLDQNDSLSDVADALGSEYKCCGDNGQGCNTSNGPARIGNQNTQFIITAYRDAGDTVTEQLNSEDKETGGWRHVIPIKNCSAKLADVVRFRSTGNHNNAARAVFLRLRDSLSRGLVARWSFEDRAQNARLTDDEDLKTSYLAVDSSKDDYTLTLCKLKTNDDSIKIENGGMDENGDSIDVYVETFGNCSKDNINGMNPKEGDAWVDGIVSEVVQANADAFGDSSSTEALYFNGNDYITALINDSECHSNDCDITANYVGTESAEKLDLKDNIAISAWVKMDSSAGGENIIVSKWNNNEGYKLYVDIVNSKICFKLNDKESCESYGTNIGSNKWANIVAMWSKDDKDIKIFVNGNDLNGTKTLSNSIDNASNVPVSIGAQLDDNNNGSTSNFFKGTIDDVRIWKRELTECEVSRLCTSAFDQEHAPSDAPTCGTVPVDC